MLIEFKVANFRSIREQQTFTLVAENVDQDMDSCLIKPELPGLSGVHFLKGAALYGANASGKTNLIQAISFVTGFVRSSFRNLEPGDETGVEPFKLDLESIQKPTEFEITFVVEGVRYVFGLSLTKIRVMEEYLVAYPKGLPQHWYSRTYDAKTNDYEWRKSSAFKHDPDLLKKTRDNTLFLSVGTQFNHSQLTPIFNWFKSGLRLLNLSAKSLFSAQFTTEMLKNEPHRIRILNLLRSADIGIVNATIQEKDRDLSKLKKFLSAEMISEIESEPGKEFKISLGHQVEGTGFVPLDFDEEESEGTRRFFALIGPWLDVLENGHTLFIDEIETSLHPLLVRELLRLLFCSENNPKEAQVIFTAHSPILLDTSLLRRDQIWFAEKNSAGATEFYPLTDYKPRREEALVKGYLAGRYGGIPFMPEGLKV